MSVSKQFDSRKNGYVFNIQHYSVHDGPGIRTVVFLKGCPLACRWCSNPESQKYCSELGYNINKCIGIAECGACLKVCPHAAIKFGEHGKITIDRAACKACFRCREACPSQALTVFGTLMSVSQVIKVVEADSVFYARSGGGLTLSGGEPLQQGEFAVELLREAKRRRINTCMETCGYADWAVLEKACTLLDSILFDIKCMNENKHLQFTNMPNKLILDNFNKICEQFPDLPKTIRTPIIPGFNDSVQDIMDIADYIACLPNVNYEVLPYHRLGQPKYEHLGRAFPMGSVTLDQEKMNIIKNAVFNKRCRKV